MKVLHVNTFDNVGGAARATYRLMKALQGCGVESHMLVARQELDDPAILGPCGTMQKGLAVARNMVDQRPVRKYLNRTGFFSPAWLCDKVGERIETEAPDVVHLNWLAAGFMRIESMAQIRRPTVYSLHDMWPFTGGCHVAGDCTRFETGCGKCPVLGSENEADLSRAVFKRKAQAWREWRPVLVSPSRWIAETAVRSPLFAGREIRVIPWCLDLEAFRPFDQHAARELLNLPQDQDVVLFGAVGATADANKGYDLLLESLRRLKAMGRPRGLTLAVFGASSGSGYGELPFPIRFLGRLHDDVSLKLLYSACDVLAVPSRQESFGQTATEAMACGTPVVAYGATGLLDIVEHEVTGYLARPYDPMDFAHGLEWVLSDPTTLGRQARARAERLFEPSRVAGLYRAAFDDAVRSHQS